MLDRLYRRFPQSPIWATILGAGIVLILTTMAVFIYIPVRGLVFPRQIVGLLEECVLENNGKKEGSITVRVSGVNHAMRFNDAADRALRAVLGQQVRLTVGALKTILLLEAATEK
jgi:hypothetical protein